MTIVVEGKNDVNKLQNIFKNANFIVTNGSEISKETINLIKITKEKDQVVLCLDPDGPGEKIRKIIVEEVSGVFQVFAKKERAISKNCKKVGIEHMSKEDILEMFDDIKPFYTEKKLTYSDLYDLGYMTSRRKRETLCQKLNISYCNGKQLLKRLNMFGITLEEIKNGCR